MAQFTCAACGETYDKDPEWSDDHARSEYEENFGGVTTSDLDVVCDECYTKIVGWAGNKGLLPTRQLLAE